MPGSGVPLDFKKQAQKTFKCFLRLPITYLASLPKGGELGRVDVGPQPGGRLIRAGERPASKGTDRAVQEV